MYRMVVADDEYIVVEGIKAILKRLNLQCEVVGFAYNGIDALDVIREKMPDIVITDIRMPGLDGLSLIEACKDFLPEAYYVVISGYTEFEYARRAITLGVVDYIDKPVTMQKIAEVMEEVEKKNNPPQYAYNRLVRETDKVVDMVLLGKAEGLEEGMENLLEVLDESVASQEQYKQEMYKIMAMLVQIFKETNPDASFRMTHRDVEAWKGKAECREHCLDLVRKMSQYLYGRKVGSNHRIIQKLLQFIDEKYAENIGLNELAMLVNMNPAYLSILFRDEVGVTYVKYLTDLRIKKAKELLSEGMKVTEVSEKVGYYNYRYFCEIFKKHQGMTPNEYRGNVRKNVAKDTIHIKSVQNPRNA